MSLYKRLADSIQQIAAEFAVAEQLPKIRLGEDQPIRHIVTGRSGKWYLSDHKNVDALIELSSLDNRLWQQDEVSQFYIEVTSWCHRHTTWRVGKMVDSDSNFDTWLRTNLRSCWDAAKEKEQTEQS